MPLLPASAETIAFENQAGKLYYQPAAYVHLAWGTGRLPLEVIQAYYEQVLRLLRQSGVRRILSEHGQREPLTQAAQQWILGEFIPRAMQLANCHHCAVVDGANPIHRLSTQAIVSAAPPDFHFHRFDTLPAADAWLRGLPLP